MSTTAIPDRFTALPDEAALDQTGIAAAINGDGSRWESARNRMFALDFATQAQQMKAIGGQPGYTLGSVHAITRDGTLVIASESGSQLAAYGQHSQVGKVLEIHTELPGRIHIVLIRHPVGY